MRIVRWVFSSYDIIYENTVAIPILTIDDVPWKIDTLNDALQILQDNNCTATFFINSYLVTSSEHRALLIQAVQQGHHLGNHGEKHKLHILLNETELTLEIENCQLLIEDIYSAAGKPLPPVKYYRPTCGLVNATVQSYCRRNNYKIVLGSNFPSDPRVRLPYLNHYYIQKHFSSHDIIILHDRPWTPELLRRLCAQIKTQSLAAGFVAPDKN